LYVLPFPSPRSSNLYISAYADNRNRIMRDLQDAESGKRSAENLLACGGSLLLSCPGYRPDGGGVRFPLPSAAACGRMQQQEQYFYDKTIRAGSRPDNRGKRCRAVL